MSTETSKKRNGVNVRKMTMTAMLSAVAFIYHHYRGCGRTFQFHSGSLFCVAAGSYL